MNKFDKTYCLATEDIYKKILTSLDLDVANRLTFGKVSTKKFFEDNIIYIVIQYSHAFRGGFGNYWLSIEKEDRMFSDSYKDYTLIELVDDSLVFSHTS